MCVSRGARSAADFLLVIEQLYEGACAHSPHGRHVAFGSHCQGRRFRGHQQTDRRHQHRRKDEQSTHIEDHRHKHRCGRFDVGTGEIAHRLQLWGRVCGALPGDGFPQEFQPDSSFESRRAKLGKNRADA